MEDHVWRQSVLTALRSAKTVTLQYHSMWKVDPNTGVVSYPSTKKRYEAPDALLSGRAGKFLLAVRQNIKYRLIPSTGLAECEDCLSKRSVRDGLLLDLSLY